MALKGSNNEEKIWIYLYEAINNKIGTAALMGNLYAESGLKPHNLQDSFEKKLGMNNTQYTHGVDSGSYSNFARDSAGYGLAQWTFWTRKQNLLNFARAKKTSVGDLETQLEFLVKELKEVFPQVFSALKSATSIKEASNKVLFDFEAPANQGDAVQKIRANYAQQYYDKYGDAIKEEKKEEASTIYELAKKSVYSKYLISALTNYISNSGGDEYGQISGGAAGDQTGKEWVMRSWYSRPWDCVLRYPNFNVALKIAEFGCMAAENDHIGYDQGQRQTYWSCLQKANYNPSKITTNCEADCSAGVIANVKAVGYVLGIRKLKDINATYTGNMKQAFINAGFQVLTASQYLSSADYLLPGDILLNEAHHTATNVTLGMKVRTGLLPGETPSYDDAQSALMLGSKGPAVKEMQQKLITLGYDLGNYGADGDFGSITFAAIKQFQRDKNITIDGVCGVVTKTYLDAAYKEKIEANKKPDPFKNFLVKIIANVLNIREEPTSNSKIVGQITDKGIYTIVDVSGNWGKLKSGAGWISLNYTQKINK